MTPSEKQFIQAAKKGELGTLQTLVAADPALLNARDRDGSTALHCATWKGHREVVAFLLAAGASVNAHNENDHWGTTPLHAAAHANHTAVAQLLLDAGADVNARDINGQTPLFHTTFHKATAVAKLLNHYNAKP